MIPTHLRSTAPFAAALFALACSAPLAIALAPQQPSAPQQQPAPPSAAEAPVPHTGTELLESSGCLHCHAFRGAGGAKGPDLTAVGKRLKPATIHDQIVNGGKTMPAFGDALTSAETDTLVDFLQHARRK